MRDKSTWYMYTHTLSRKLKALYRELGSSEEVEAAIGGGGGGGGGGRAGGRGGGRGNRGGGGGAPKWKGRQERIRQLEDQLTSMRGLLADLELRNGGKPGSRGSDSAAGAAEGTKLEEYR